MSKRISEVERITNYFQTADESATAVMFEVVKSILAKRFAKEKPTRKPRGPNKSKGSEPPSLLTSQADAQGTSGPRCAICGKKETYADHQPGADSYHIFRTDLKKKTAHGNALES